MKNYTIERLSNKIPLISAPVPSSKTVTILVMVKTGSRYETRETNGLSHFVEHMLFKGTKKRPTALQISSELDSLGGEYNAFTSKEYTGYWVKVAKTKAKKALDILGDMVLNSVFAEEEIRKESGVIVEELNMYKDNAMEHVGDIFESCLYGDTPMGWETIGTKENILKFTSQDFINYFQAQYGANSFGIIVAGAVDQGIKKKVKNIFSQAKDNPWKNKLKVSNIQKKPQLKVIHKDNNQTNLALGMRICAIDHKDEFVARVISVILGGAMSSRLFTELREKRGLAYYVYTHVDFYPDTAFLVTQSGVRKNEVEEAIKTIIREYKKLADEGVSEEELKRTKDLILGKVPIQLEGTDDLANWYGRQFVLRKKIISPLEYQKKIKAVTSKDIKRVAKKIFVNEKLNLAVIGSVSEKKLQSILHF